MYVFIYMFIYVYLYWSSYILLKLHILITFPYYVLTDLICFRCEDDSTIFHVIYIYPFLDPTSAMKTSIWRWVFLRWHLVFNIFLCIWHRCYMHRINFICFGTHVVTLVKSGSRKIMNDMHFNGTVFSACGPYRKVDSVPYCRLHCIDI